VDPTPTRANRINSDILDWSYIGTSFADVCGLAFDERACEGRYPKLIQVHADRRLPDGQRQASPDTTICEGSPQRLGVNILPDVRHLAVSNGNVEDPIALETAYSCI
jgi:hypothetical protein